MHVEGSVLGTVGESESIQMLQSGSCLALCN